MWKRGKNASRICMHFKNWDGGGGLFNSVRILDYPNNRGIGFNHDQDPNPIGKLIWINPNSIDKLGLNSIGRGGGTHFLKLCVAWCDLRPPPHYDGG